MSISAFYCFEKEAIPEIPTSGYSQDNIQHVIQGHMTPLAQLQPPLHVTFTPGEQ